MFAAGKADFQAVPAELAGLCVELKNAEAKTVRVRGLPQENDGEQELVSAPAQRPLIGNQALSPYSCFTPMTGSP